MDVKFMCEMEIINSLSQENWEQIKVQRGEKKLFLIEDYDINSMFMVYI